MGRKDDSGRPNADKAVEEEALKLLQSDKAQKRKHLSLKGVAEKLPISNMTVKNVAKWRIVKCFR